MLEVSCPRFLEAHERLEAPGLRPRGLGLRHPAPRGGGRRRAGGAAHRGRSSTGRQRPGRVERIVPSLEDVFIHCIEQEDAARAAPRRRMSPRKIWAIAGKELRQAAARSAEPGHAPRRADHDAPALRLRDQLRRAPRAPRRCRTWTRAARAATSWRPSSTRPTSTRWPSLSAGADLERLTERRMARAVLVIPEGYARDLAGRAAAPRSSSCSTAPTPTPRPPSSATPRPSSPRPTPSSWPCRGRRPDRGRPIDYEPRVWYNPELKSTQFLVPGLIGFILMLTAVLSTALSVVREKERGHAWSSSASPRSARAS